VERDPADARSTACTRASSSKRADRGPWPESPTGEARPWRAGRWKHPVAEPAAAPGVCATWGPAVRPSRALGGGQRRLRDPRDGVRVGPRHVVERVDELTGLCGGLLRGGLRHVGRGPLLRASPRRLRAARGVAALGLPRRPRADADHLRAQPHHVDQRLRRALEEEVRAPERRCSRHPRGGVRRGRRLPERRALASITSAVTPAGATGAGRLRSARWREHDDGPGRAAPAWPVRDASPAPPSARSTRPRAAGRSAKTYR